jgi:hypothetical protein
MELHAPPFTQRLDVPRSGLDERVLSWRCGVPVAAHAQRLQSFRVV